MRNNLHAFDFRAATASFKSWEEIADCTLEDRTRAVTILTLHSESKGWKRNEHLLESGVHLLLSHHVLFLRTYVDSCWDVRLAKKAASTFLPRSPSPTSRGHLPLPRTLNQNKS